MRCSFYSSKSKKNSNPSLRKYQTVTKRKGTPGIDGTKICSRSEDLLVDKLTNLRFSTSQTFSFRPAFNFNQLPQQLLFALLLLVFCLLMKNYTQSGEIKGTTTWEKKENFVRLQCKYKQKSVSKLFLVFFVVKIYLVHSLDKTNKKADT